MIILTGGAGFIGSCLLWKLNQKNIRDIIIVDDLDNSDKWLNLRGKQFLDYLQKEEIWDFLGKINSKKIKKIIHLGAFTSTVSKDALYFLQNNYRYSQRLAIWAEEHGVKFIYASSAATYGNGELGYDDDEKILPSLKPLNIYAYSKHLFDLWVLQKGLFKKFLGIKFFNVFGPNEYHKGEMMSLVGKYFREIKDGQPLRLFKSYRPDYPDGEQKRDFVYVKDVVEVMYYFYQHPKISGIFNLGSGQARSWNDLALALFSALRQSPRIEYVDMPSFLREQYQYFTQAKMDKLRRVGCRHRFMSLEEAVRDYVNYLQNHSYL